MRALGTSQQCANFYWSMGLTQMLLRPNAALTFFCTWDYHACLNPRETLLTTTKIDRISPALLHWNGNTDLDRMARDNHCPSPYIETQRLLLDAGADPTLAIGQGTSALQHAILSGDIVHSTTSLLILH